MVPVISSLCRVDSFILLLVLLLLGGCGEQSGEDGAPGRAAAEALIGAIRGKDAATVLASIEAPPDDPTNANVGGIAGIGQALMIFDVVSFSLGQGHVHNDTVLPTSTFRVRLERTSPLGSGVTAPTIPWAGSRGEPVISDLVMKRHEAGWRATQASARLLLHDGVSLVEGVSTKERLTRITLSLVAFSVEIESLKAQRMPSKQELVAPGNNSLEPWPTDEWGRPIRYAQAGDRDYDLRSAGPDGAFNTPDDLVRIQRVNR